MKDREEKSMGLVTLIPEALVKIKPTDPLVEPLIFAKLYAVRKKRDPILFFYYDR